MYPNDEPSSALEPGDPSAPFIELVYVSSADPASISEQVLSDILASARKRNAEFGVTGVLLYQAGTFVQLLEGPADAVRHIYHDRICQDRRHGGLVLCWEQNISQRGFPDWSMGYFGGGRLADAAGACLPSWIESGLAGLDLSGPDSTGRRLLRSLVRAG